MSTLCRFSIKDAGSFLTLQYYKEKEPALKKVCFATTTKVPGKTRGRAGIK